MNKLSSVLVISSLSFASLVLFLSPAHSSPIVLDKKFANCAALNKVYPGGVAKNSKVKNKGGATKNKPVVNSKVYKSNSSKDRDKDGIACER